MKTNNCWGDLTDIFGYKGSIAPEFPVVLNDAHLHVEHVIQHDTKLVVQRV